MTRRETFELGILKFLNKHDMLVEEWAFMQDDFAEVIVIDGDRSARYRFVLVGDNVLANEVAYDIG